MKQSGHYLKIRQNTFSTEIRRRENKDNYNKNRDNTCHNCGKIGYFKNVSRQKFIDETRINNTDRSKRNIEKIRKTEKILNTRISGNLLDFHKLIPNPNETNKKYFEILPKNYHTFASLKRNENFVDEILNHLTRENVIKS